MKPVKAHNVDLVIRDGDEKAPPVAPQPFLRAVYAVVAYLDQVTEYAPGFKAMGAEDRVTYVVAYAAPLNMAKADAADLMPAAVRYVTKNRNYPKSPAALLEYVWIVKEDRVSRAIVDAPALAMRCEEPGVSPEERERIRRQAIETMGMDELEVRRIRRLKGYEPYPPDKEKEDIQRQ